MKKYYKYGELLLALREEYNEYKDLLKELEKYIEIKSEYADFYFSGSLSKDKSQKRLEDRRIILQVEKKYSSIKKMIERLKYDWYSSYMYSAFFNIEKKESGLYVARYNNIVTPVDGNKYVPNVKITDQENFSKIIDQLLSTDIMQLRDGHFTNNYDSIFLDFDNASISSNFGCHYYITWDGREDKYSYSVREQCSSDLIENILSLEIPADKISPEWLNILEKHKNLLSKESYFTVDKNVISKNGTLQISNIENRKDYNIVRLAKTRK